MATTCQQIQDRAVAWSTANGLQTLVGDRAEIINRIASDERGLFDLAASENAYYYATATLTTSTSGSSGRTIDTASLSPLVGRILRVDLASGEEIRQVDLRDTDAELAPRYFVRGTTLVEVSNDWSASTGTVNVTVTYMRRPAVLDPDGALSQTVTLEDRFADLLEMKLAWYLAHKDVGREGAELQRLEQQIAARTAEYVRAIQQYAGAETRRFVLPSEGTKR